MTHINVCTVITRNRLAHARVLARSFLDHNPGGTITALLVDDLEREISGEPFAVLHPEETGLDRRELHRMATIYDALELACALKPWALECILEGGADVAVYVDSDIEIHGDLSPAVELARECSLVLTPHLPTPEPQASSAEESALLAGTFNAGFLAVGESARPFLSWWKARLARDCTHDPKRGLFGDQRWLDLATGSFEHAVLRDPAWNLGFWNLPGRRFEERSGRYLVDGSPVRCLHFAGFNAEQPWLLSRWLMPDRLILLSEEPALARLCQEYAARLLDDGYAEGLSVPYAFETLPNGLRIDSRMRRLYRELLLTSEAGTSVEPPSPFDGGGEAFVAWLHVAPDRRWKAAQVNRYLRAVWDERPDLQAAFPVLVGDDADRLLDWAAASGVGTAEIPAELTTSAGEPALPAAHHLVWPESLEPGVNLVARFDGERELDELARRICSALERAGVSVSRIAFPDEGDPFTSLRADAVRHDLNLLVLEAGEIPAFAYWVPGRFFAERATVAVVDQTQWSRVPENVDEVVAAVELVMPPSGDVGPSDSSPLSRAAEFSVLSLVDLTRDDPAPLVGAYVSAFGPDDGAALVLHMVARAFDPLALERIRVSTDRSDVLVRTGPLQSSERLALIAACGCYVSLRTVGLDLALLDRRALGKPSLTASEVSVTRLRAARSEPPGIPRERDSTPALVDLIDRLRPPRARNTASTPSRLRRFWPKGLPG